MLLQTKHVSKQFNGIYALKDIHFELDAGEIHGLVGENGAGKSTLIKLLTGVYHLDEGEILWNDQVVHIKNAVESRKIGINVIHQDRTLIPTFNGVENAYLGLPYLTKKGRIDWKAMKAQVECVADSLGIELDLSKSASELSPPQRTCLEIVRAMMVDCQLLILDEPTASLTDKESEILFSIIQKLKQQGTSILYVSHRMDEIFRLTDRITILKNGLFVQTLQTKETTKEQLIEKMTDQWVGEAIHHATTFGDPLLQVSHLQSKDQVVKDASFKAHRGEILGVFGLGGSGRTELLECIYGYRAKKSGEITIDGKAQDRMNPHSAIVQGMVLICEDRRAKALIGSMSVKENVLLSSIDAFASHGILQTKKENQSVSNQIDHLHIKLASMDQRVLELSGGNQQKVVFAKAMMTDPHIFLCDEPTQAVDVKTRNDIHQLLRHKADEGNAVVFVTSDLKEMLEVADRIVIMASGRTTTCLTNDQTLTAKQVLSYCYTDEKRGLA